MALMDEKSEQQARLAELKAQHRSLDDAITEMKAAPGHNQLEIQRLKKEKLALRDGISRLESILFPDIIA
ncbi:MAG: DUF465 domain-containing protein [Rhodospirillales bacterium]|jgi:hypothetical protein